MKLNDITKAHFVGVGGIGMSALARLFVHEGKKVSGSDRMQSEITKALTEEGVHFTSTQVASNVTDGIDIVVYTEAMPHDHEELVQARALGIVTMNYFEALGMVANEYYLIAVAGSHGKTTTTAMLIDIFEEAGFDPSAIVGSLRSKTKSNYRAGKSKYFIVEACEYKRDFLSLTPDVLIITNIEHEHVDYYKDLGAVQQAFREFAMQVREGGVVIMNFSGDNIAPILEGLTVSIIDYGKYLNPLRVLTMPGVHNQLNAAAAIAGAEYAGISTRTADTALAHFAGTWRRFEYKGEVNGAKVYDDYGHHPTEIKATLKGAREMFPNKKVLLVYQPHLDSRTETLFDNFVTELGTVDHLILTPAYVARAVGGSPDSTKKLASTIAQNNHNTEYIENFEDIVTRVKEISTNAYVVLVMGAGNITEVSRKLIT